MSMSRTVCIEQYTLEVEITSYTPGRSGVFSGPPEHCYPDEPEELEFEVVSGVIEDEDGNEEDLGRNGCAAVAEQYAEEIEQKLMDQLADEADDCDYDDSRDWEAA